MQVQRRFRNYSIALLLAVVAMLGIQAKWFVNAVLREESAIHDQISTAVCSAFVSVIDEDATGICASKCANLGGGEFELQTESELSGLDSIIRKELSRIDEIAVPFKVTLSSRAVPQSLNSGQEQFAVRSDNYQMAHVNLAVPTRVHFFADHINKDIVWYSIFVCLAGLVFFNVVKSISSLQSTYVHTRSYEKGTIYRIGKYTFDFKNQELSIHQKSRRITEKESRLLRVLCSKKNQLVRRDEILTQLWGENDYFKGRSLDVFVARLRKYLSKDRNIRIETIYGVGFVLKDE
jgi:hypothetical protein